MNNALLKINGLTLQYGGSVALNRVSIDVPKGSIISVIGANGAGKSSLLNAISGLIKPASGGIYFNGRRIDGQPPDSISRLGIRLCPERRRLFPSMTLLENLKVGCYLRKSSAEVTEAIEEILERFPALRERKGQKARTLSGGEQQMLAIARALVGNPELLLLDESSFGLAPMLVQSLREIVRNINQSGVTVFLAEQNSLLALKLAQYAYVLEKGTIALQGEVADLLHSGYVRAAYLGM